MLFPMAYQPLISDNHLLSYLGFKYFTAEIREFSAKDKTSTENLKCLPFYLVFMVFPTAHQPVLSDNNLLSYLGFKYFTAEIREFSAKDKTSIENLKCLTFYLVFYALSNGTSATHIG